MYNIASYKEFKILFFFIFLNLMAEEALPKNWMILKGPGHVPRTWMIRKALLKNWSTL